MCGIFSYFGNLANEEVLIGHFNKLQHRGPDDTQWKKVDNDTFLGFHRLAINGQNTDSNQPMFDKGVWLIANAEIFNYKKLAAKYSVQLTTGSDCEIILKLYQLLEFEELLKELDGEFAFVIYDSRQSKILAARDHLGVRGMYMARSDDYSQVAFASESKALVFMDRIEQFPPGSFWCSSSPLTFNQYYHHNYEYHKDQSEEIHLKNIRLLLEKAVKKRMMSDRPVACLLSGGLDSSLVTALASKYCRDGERIKTFSIGLEGSPDLIAAQEVADHIGTEHHHVELSEQDFLNAINETIYLLGSYDVTTIRASVGHMLISKYVRDNTDVKVLFSGETADEFGSYLYFQNAPSSSDFQNEAIRLLTDIHFFDMKRGDRSISSAGLEARVPFADKDFVRYYMGIKPEMRMFGVDKVEKFLIRKAFEDTDLLPKSVLWRRKNGFSDSVSKKERSWSIIIQEYIDTIISDAEFESQSKVMEHNKPLTKEAYYYRKVFNSHYGKHQNLTPYQWLPRWCGNIVDPSARVLDMYEAD